MKNMFKSTQELLVKDGQGDPMGFQDCFDPLRERIKAVFVVQWYVEGLPRWQLECSEVGIVRVTVLLWVNSERGGGNDKRDDE
ncbi:hypothetical protein Tco_1380690 [Tanacetum coccineum]